MLESKKGSKISYKVKNGQAETERSRVTGVET
jgi:hypothetical protein